MEILQSIIAFSQLPVLESNIKPDIVGTNATANDYSQTYVFEDGHAGNTSVELKLIKHKMKSKGKI